MLRLIPFVACLALSATAAFATPEASLPGSQFSISSGFLAGGFDLRIWVVSHDSGYHNAFGITESFDDAGAGTIVFGDSVTLAFGDYVDVPVGGSGLVVPFVLADFNASELDWYGQGNTDGFSHIEFANVGTHAGSFWWAIAIDDQAGGGDRDWNDLRLAFQFTPSVAAPEPGTWALIVGFAAVVALFWRRRIALA